MDKTLGLFGLAKKGGNAAVGEDPVTDAVRRGLAAAVFVAADAAENTAHRACMLAKKGQTVFLALPYTKEELGGALGRQSCAVLALTNAGLAAAVIRSLAGGPAPGLAAWVLQKMEAEEKQPVRRARRKGKNVR